MWLGWPDFPELRSSDIASPLPVRTWSTHRPPFPTRCQRSQTVRDGVAVTELGRDIWPLVVLGIVLIPFGIWAFGRAEHYASRAAS